MQNAAHAVWKKNGSLYLQMDGFFVSFRSEEDSLLVETRRGEAPAEEKADEASMLLPDGFSLHLGGKNYLWELKRFSIPICTVFSYTLRKNQADEITRITQTGSLDALYVWGTGERFDKVNQQNLGSNGRVVEKFTQQGNETYLPIPFFLTEKHLGWFRQGSVPTAINFLNGFRLSQEVCGDGLTSDRLFFGKPSVLVRQFIKVTGQPILPPPWAFGVWISANGWNCDAEVDAQLAALRKYNYPADVMVLEAWSDEQTFYRWNDENHWKNPAQMVRRVRDAGLHLVLWQIPIIKYEWDKEPNESLRKDIQEATERGYCIRYADGHPYRITENWFHHSLLMDFTNPDALDWWFNKRKALLEMGVEGFKTDGGEFLFDREVRLFNGQTGLEAHNLYPSQYIGAYHDFLRQNGVDGVTFSRADFTGAQTRPLHWAGDQLSLWTELSAQLKAGISAGMSGVLFWGFDIGGFAGELPSAELYLRATAMACFCPVMQWHAEPRSGQFYATHEDGFVNDRSPWNLAEKLGEPLVLTVATAFAMLRKKLQSYLWHEARFCVENNRPLMAHLCLDFPEDETALGCEDEYLLGRRLLVAPIVEEGIDGRMVYLPAGTWRHYFTGEIRQGEQKFYAAVPLSRIEVWEKQ